MWLFAFFFSASRIFRFSSGKYLPPIQNSCLSPAFSVCFNTRATPYLLTISNNLLQIISITLDASIGFGSSHFELVIITATHARSFISKNWMQSYNIANILIFSQMFQSFFCPVSDKKLLGSQPKNLFLCCYLSFEHRFYNHLGNSKH